MDIVVQEGGVGWMCILALVDMGEYIKASLKVRGQDEGRRVERRGGDREGELDVSDLFIQHLLRMIKVIAQRLVNPNS